MVPASLVRFPWDRYGEQFPVSIYRYPYAPDVGNPGLRPEDDSANFQKQASQRNFLRADSSIEARRLS